ncbi:hypothetical protein pqer_cds_980 [Pandoravirus quercus]|uniref:F-box domain containing protein n=2 Tax=Pandoravirus TaxID=2060084 RepID=A0A2U7UAH8_9VIRU|nr:hypothetical protein pqer_cds_980 [Pandoravirus quercus]AVK75402.1 hypothetical protein pqer_cds_980 [Pandoravirus quercus]QBZ81580.1 hypothetical protein pclt_cds_994 [Pandoravirus celtis]
MTETTKRQRHESSPLDSWTACWWAQTKRRCLAPGAMYDDSVDDGDRMVDKGGDLVYGNTADNQPTLLSLPPEMLAAIASHCAIDALVRLRRTSRALNVVASRALDCRQSRVMATVSIRLHPWMAGHFFNDNADAVGVLLMTGYLCESMCFSGGDDCVLDFHAIRAGDRPFDCEVHGGGAFLTMSPVALAIWVGAANVLALLARTTMRRGHTRQPLLAAAAKAADRARQCGRTYPLGAVIDTIIGMTPPTGLLRHFLSVHLDEEPPLVSLLRAAQAAASVIALEGVSPFDSHLTRVGLDDTVAVLGASPWQLERLVDRACGGVAYSAQERANALYLVLAAAQQVQLARGVAALVSAGLGPDTRMGGRTVRETFFSLVSQEPPEDRGSRLNPVVAIAHATLALLTMILCDHGLAT